MKTLKLVVCLAIFLGGCGSDMGSTANNVTMQAGQWEYLVVPENGVIPMYIEANLPGTNGPVTGTNLQIFQPAEEVMAPYQSGGLYCGNFNLNGSISDNSLSGKLSWGEPASHFANFSGELAPNGESISKGRYSGQACLFDVGPGHPGPHVQGALVGYMIAPVNGTFTGTLDSSLYGADVVTLTITQNSDFSLNVAGTSVENGVTTVLIPAPQNSVVFGATVAIMGAAKNVNGSQAFSMEGHLNPTSTQLTIATMSFGGTETVTGTLTKQ
jgi:hypothetical protein